MGERIDGGAATEHDASEGDEHDSEAAIQTVTSNNFRCRLFEFCKHW